MDGATWLDDIRALYRNAKSMAERAAAQVSDADFFRTCGPASIASVMKHVGGNHRSRWRDFLTTDGEKRDRNRDGEFVVEGETRASIEAGWDAGWAVAVASLESLGPDDLDRTITIRGEPHSVVAAIHRNLNHVNYHTGQIVLVARQLVGDDWQMLSIPPGKSDEHNASMRARFGDWWGAEERGSDA